MIGRPGPAALARRFPIHAKRCPCGETGSAPAPAECGSCETFWCNRCERWVDWNLGCADDAPALCDDCYAAVILPSVEGRDALVEVPG